MTAFGEDIAKASELLQDYAGLSQDDHGANTPKRFLEMLSELTACSPDARSETHEGTCIKWADFPCTEDERDMIIIQDIPFISMCNHHVIPFIGKAHIGYVPNAKIGGLSKFARVVQHFARQLQVQERMTSQIADYLFAKLEPKGVAVVARAEHMCMTIRGVQAPGAFTTTSVMRGVFADHDRTAKAEFMAIVNSNGHK